ncbi:reverse transcriptase [Phytophthora megakarya]|uniref:Reverse transcriptase n=1 Tax=Phytophthora megakarya TaxID=4795 RepID=A0A225VYW0_9STRA|nr:reverse transcriptase [Phytophthora megakarya]
MKTVLRGDMRKMTYKEAREAWKWADKFVLSSDNMLYYVGPSRRKLDEDHDTGGSPKLRTSRSSPVIPESKKLNYYWIGLYADVEKHVKSCLDCSSSKSLPQFKGYSPGNLLAERPFQVVSMDFVIPLPKSRRGNTALLLWQCAFTGFVIAKAMSDTDALTVAKVFEESIYQRSVKTVMQSVNVYVEAPLQQDWDEIAERLVFAVTIRTI